MRRSVEPEMPGSTMAVMAIMAVKNTYTTSPSDRCSTDTLIPSPPEGLKLGDAKYQQNSYKGEYNISVPVFKNFFFLTDHHGNGE